MSFGVRCPTNTVTFSTPLTSSMCCGRRAGATAPVRHYARGQSQRPGAVAAARADRPCWFIYPVSSRQFQWIKCCVRLRCRTCKGVIIPTSGDKPCCNAHLERLPLQRGYRGWRGPEATPATDEVCGGLVSITDRRTNCSPRCDHTRLPADLSSWVNRGRT